jgi:hypothetical protein
MRRIAIATPLVAALAAACASSNATPSTSEEVKPVRVASTGIAYGDCKEARIRAAAKPDLDVDRIPSPVTMKPRPFVGFPRSALRKDGSATIKVDVVVDTTGRADMSTFRVVDVSHPWFEKNLRSVLPKWRFTPAELAGCRVARVYHFMASLPPRTRGGSGR